MGDFGAPARHASAIICLRLFAFVQPIISADYVETKGKRGAQVTHGVAVIIDLSP